MLSRSASGPGGLGINTGSANIFGSTNNNSTGQGLFGSAQTSQPQGNLFGNSTNFSQPQQQSGNLFGNTTNNNNQQQGGGLFGNNANLFGSSLANNNQQQQGGGIFGNQQNNQQQQQGGFGSSIMASGGLFGNSTQQPAQSGGLFGNSTQQQPAQTGGLFGNSTQQQPAQTGGLFGNSTNQQQQPAQSGGLFGNLNTQNRPATSSLFGQTQTQQQPAGTSSLFSQPQQQQTPAFANGLTLGQGASGNQPTVPGVRIDMSNIRTTTRFNDLHEDLQKEIEAIDKAIQLQMHLKKDCDAMMPSHASSLSHMPSDVDFLSRKFVGVEEALRSDAENIGNMQKCVREDAETAKLCFEGVDELRLPVQYHQQSVSGGSMWKTGNEGEEKRDLVSFFSSTADELKGRLDTYKNHVQQVEQHLRGVEAATMGQLQQLANSGRGGGVVDRQEQQLELMAVLREFEEGVLGVAGNVGLAREKMQQLQLGGLPPMNGRGTLRGKRSGIY